MEEGRREGGGGKGDREKRNMKNDELENCIKPAPTQKKKGTAAPPTKGGHVPPFFLCGAAFSSSLWSGAAVLPSSFWVVPIAPLLPPPFGLCRVCFGTGSLICMV